MTDPTPEVPARGRPSPAVTWWDLEDVARATLPRDVFDFIVGGAEDEHALRGSLEAWSRYRLQPRVLRGTGVADPAVELLGTRLSAPVVVAPMGAHVLVHEDAEGATARGAASAGVGQIISTASSTLLEDEASQHPAPWFQLYAYRDRGVTSDLVQRARAAGCRAIVLTVDTPVLGIRRRDLRNRFAPTNRWVNLERYAAATLPDVTDGSAVMSYIAGQLDPALDWDDLRDLVATSPLPVVVKGVLHPSDARRALDCGVAAVYVSSHGGRQLDRGVAPVTALPRVVEACDGDVPVLLDGGVRTASDVVVALGLGASAVAVGRPVLWALAADGEEGVARFLGDLVSTTATTLTLMGATAPDAVDEDGVIPA